MLKQSVLFNPVSLFTLSNNNYNCGNRFLTCTSFNSNFSFQSKEYKMSKQNMILQKEKLLTMQSLSSINISSTNLASENSTAPKVQGLQKVSHTTSDSISNSINQKKKSTTSWPSVTTIPSTQNNFSNLNETRVSNTKTSSENKIRISLKDDNDYFNPDTCVELHREEECINCKGKQRLATFNTILLIFLFVYCNETA